MPSTLHQQLQFWNRDHVEVVDADLFSFIADVKIQDAMLYSPKIEPISWPEDITLDSIMSFDLSLDVFEVVVQADSWLLGNHNGGA